MPLSHYWYDWGGLNRWLFELAQRARSPEVDFLSSVLSILGSFWLAPIYGLLIGAQALRIVRSRRGHGIVGYHMVQRWETVFFRYLIAVIVAVAIVWAIKTTWLLPRPSEIYGLSVVASPFLMDSVASFPSGHSAAAAVLVASLWPAFRQPDLRIALLLFVLAVGVSRIVTGVHFPADVLAGYLVGLVSAWFAAGAVQWIERLFAGSREQPRKEGGRP